METLLRSEDSREFDRLLGCDVGVRLQQSRVQVGGGGEILESSWILVGCFEREKVRILNSPTYHYVLREFDKIE